MNLSEFLKIRMNSIILRPKLVETDNHVTVGKESVPAGSVNKNALGYGAFDVALKKKKLREI